MILREENLEYTPENKKYSLERKAVEQNLPLAMAAFCRALSMFFFFRYAIILPEILLVVKILHNL